MNRFVVRTVSVGTFSVERTTLSQSVGWGRHSTGPLGFSDRWNGHFYLWRFKSFPIPDDEHLRTVPGEEFGAGRVG